VSTVQVVTFGWQKPGYEVVVVHMGSCAPASGAAGGGGGGAPVPDPPPLPVPEEAPLPTVPEPPEQAPETVGLHEKPSPQSESRLHGSCHLNAHTLVVVVVQVGSITMGGPASHFMLGPQGVATVLPPEQAVDVCA
jgi:hypothetical protein